MAARARQPFLIKRATTRKWEVIERASNKVLGVCTTRSAAADLARKLMDADRNLPDASEKKEGRND